VSYYYLGLEANQRDNTYTELDKALRDATWAAKQMVYPIRIFEMLDHGIHQLITVVRPEDPLFEAPDDVLSR